MLVAVLSPTTYSYLLKLIANICKYRCLTLSGLNFPLSSSSTTSRELLSQFLTCSGWRWFDVGEKVKKNAMYWWASFVDFFVLKPLVVGKLGLFSRMYYDALMHREVLTLYPPNYSIAIFTHLKLCLADAIHNFKWVTIMQIWQNRSQLFSNRADWCHIMALTCWKGGTECGNN